jgi:hypothetical protein
MHLAYPVRDGDFFGILFNVNETYFGFWVSTTIGDSLNVSSLACCTTCSLSFLVKIYL